LKMVPSPENVVTASTTVDDKPEVLRSLVSSLGEKTLGFYTTAKGYSPLEIPSDLEQSVIDFTKNKYTEFGDPLVSKLDSTIDSTEEYIRTTVEVTKTQVTETYEKTYESAESFLKDNVIAPYSETIVAPTEEYIKYAHEYIHENKTVVVEKLQTSVIKPYQENVYEPTEKIIKAAVDTASDTYTTAETFIKDKAISPTEQYIKSSVQLAQDRVRETEEMIKTSRESLQTAYAAKVVTPTEELLNSTWATVMDTADKAVDYLLPELEESSPATPPPSSDELSTKTKKIAARLRRAAGSAVAHSQERLSEIVHVDLIAYAKETVGADDKKLAEVFDKVVSALPTTETTDKVVNAVMDKVPAKALPIVKVVTEQAVPVVNYSLEFLIQTIVSLRQKVVETGPADLPAPVLIAAADSDVDDDAADANDEFKDPQESLPAAADAAADDDDDADDVE